MSHPASKAGLFCFILVFMTFWTFVVSIFDVFIGYGLYNQIRSTQFETTQGVILTSEVNSEKGNESTVYQPRVTYEYEVDNESFQGDRIRYGEIVIGGPRADLFVADHPVGKTVDVHFDPTNPSDAALVTGLEGPSLFMLMFLTPFNVIMVGGWYLLGRLTWGWILPTPPSRVSDNGYEMRIMVNRVSLFAVFGFCLLATSFINIFVVGIGTAIFSSAGFGDQPSLPAMLIVWIFNLSVSALVTSRYAARNWSGQYDIVVRQVEKKITLPISAKRKETVTLSFKEIEEVFVDKNTNIDFDNVEQHSYCVKLRLAPDSKPSTKNRKDIELLTSFQGQDEDRAYQFASWFATDVLKRKELLQQTTQHA